jgi:hypothetical protein
MSDGLGDLLAAMRAATERTADLNGVPWFEAPAPPLFHRHWAQTSGLGMWRCPCGAIGGPGEPWVLLDRRNVRWFPPLGRRRAGVVDRPRAGKEKQG